MDNRVLLGAVGEKDAVLAFRAVGMHSLPASTEAEVRQAIHRLKGEGVKVIFITEAAARLGLEVLERYRNDPELTIIPVPGAFGSDGFGLDQLRQNVLKAIGADIQLQNDRKEEE